MNTQNLTLSFSPSLEPNESGALPRFFSGTAYSGGLVPGYGYYGDVAIDLGSIQNSEQPLFALLNHDRDQRAGKFVIHNTGNELQIRSGEFFKSTSAGVQIASEFAEGAPWQLSVGISATTEFFRKPTEVHLNGRTMTVDTVMRDARILEVSFVPAGADPNTSVVAFEANPYLTSKKESMMNDSHTDATLSESLDRVNQLNAQLNLKISELEKSLAVFESDLVDLNARLEAEMQQTQVQFNRANEAENELLSLKKSIRLSAIKSLFHDLDMDSQDENKLLPYLNMSEEMFSAVCDDFRQLKRPSIKPDFFRETATAGQSSKETNYASQLLNQVAGVK